MWTTPAVDNGGGVVVGSIKGVGHVQENSMLGMAGVKSFFQTFYSQEGVLHNGTSRH